MSTMAYKCPCCGAPLSYDGASQKLVCTACSNTYEPDALEDMNLSREGSEISFDMPTEGYSEAEAQAMQAYICKSCGAELVTEDTTTATQCPYCGSPTILPEQLEGGIKPEKAIPFTVTQEQAQNQFHEYFKGKRLLPNLFLEGRNRISEIQKLYVPYWLFDCDAYADIVYDAKKSRTHREGDWEITRTEHYAVRRAGNLGFDGIPVDGSQKMDDKITESLEPYDMGAAQDFHPAMLAGSLADHADVNAEDCQSRAVERVEKSISDTLRGTVTGYDSVNERKHYFDSEGGKVTPVLMPVWLITTQKGENTYTFAINGQTGKLTCDVPVSKGKAFAWFGGVFAGAFGLGALILWLMKMLESGTALIAGVVALIIAALVVAGLVGQLKQASFQDSAANYVREDSFNLNISYDRYLYTTVKRRKIETEKKESN